PLYADLAGLAPMYIQVGGDETLLDDSRRLAEHARTVGVEVRLDIFPGQQHTFQMAAGRAPEADDAIRRMAAWVRPKLRLGQTVPAGATRSTVLRRGSPGPGTGGHRPAPRHHRDWRLSRRVPCPDGARSPVPRPVVAGLSAVRWCCC